MAHKPDVILPDAAEITDALKHLKLALDSSVDDGDVASIALGIAASYRQRCEADPGIMPREAADIFEDIDKRGRQLLSLLSRFGLGAYGLGATATMEWPKPLPNLHAPDEVTAQLKSEAEYLRKVLATFLAKIEPRRKRWDLRGNPSVRWRIEGTPRDRLVYRVYHELWLLRRPNDSPDCPEFRAACDAVLDLSGVQHGTPGEPQDAVLKHSLGKFLDDIAEK